MNVCIIGDGLTGLSLAKNLVDKKINVHIYYMEKISDLSSNRTIGITSENLDFFEKKIIKLPRRNIWKINEIEIYSEKLRNEKILSFGNNEKNLFYLIKNDYLNKILNDKLLKSHIFKKIKIKSDKFYEKILKKNRYDLVINCETENIFSKKYFSKKINKDYYSNAYTTIIEHKEIKNNTAIQIFTKFGPIAFLPISKKKTSIVCSLNTKNKKFIDCEILELINKNNPKFKIKKIFKINSFQLKFSSLRNYYYKNILAFGDLLHKIHPLAGQGFNMTIRDIKVLSEIIQNKIDLGMTLDMSILEEFEKKNKHVNFIFSNGIDFIYEFFNFEKKIKDKNFDKLIKLFNTNENLKKSIVKFANEGLNL